MDPTSPDAMAQALGEWNPQPTPKPGPALGYIGDYTKSLWGPSWAEKAQAQSEKDQAGGYDWKGNADLAKDLAWGAIMAGPNSRTADLGKLAEAKRLNELYQGSSGPIKAGASPRSIWDRTGWFQGADKLWRYEIPDRGAVLRQGAPQVLGDKIDHPGLFDAYPSMESTFLDFNNPQGKASYNAGMDTINLPEDYEQAEGAAGIPLQKATTMHEIQHAIQSREGFARGASPRMFEKYLRTAYPKTPIGDIPGIATNIYNRHAGEVEANNVGLRSVRPKEYSENPPWVTQPFSYNQQILGPSVGHPFADPTNQDYVNALMQQGNFKDLLKKTK